MLAAPVGVTVFADVARGKVGAMSACLINCPFVATIVRSRPASAAASSSHVCSDGRTVRIDLHDSSRVEEILRLTTPLTNEFPIRYMVGRGVGGSREPELRAHVLSILDQAFPKTRQSRYTSAIEIAPELPEKLRNQRKRVNMLLAIFLPIASFLGWLEMR